MESRRRWLGVLGALILGFVTLGCQMLGDRTVGSGWATAADPGTVARSPVAPASHEQPIEADEAPTRDEPRKPAWSVEDFYPSHLGATFNRLTGKGPNEVAARQLFDEAEQCYRRAVSLKSKPDDDEARKLFEEAAELYVDAARRWPETVLEEDALFRAAESYFFADRYPAASAQTELLLKKFPNTRYLDLVGTRRFMIAKYWLELDEADHRNPVNVNWTNPARPKTDTFGYAIRVLDKMRIDDPLGKLADDATLAAANACFVRGKFVKADQYYSDLRKNFPSSEHQFLAHFLGVKAKLESYKGPDFAGTVLDEAEKLVTQIRRQFPTESREHDAELTRLAAEIQFRKAEREWNMAQYYEQRGEYRAARYYYQRIFEKYAHTPFRAEAAERLGQTADRPAVPPQRLGWLIKMFPDAHEQKPLLATRPREAARR